MNIGLKAATAIVAGLRKLIAGLVVVFFAYMIVAVLVQIAGRYLFDFAIDWTAETATFAQIWMVLLAGGLAMRDNLHVSVDALTSHLPTSALRGLVIVVTLPCLWPVPVRPAAVARPRYPRSPSSDSLNQCPVLPERTNLPQPINSNLQLEFC